jgi:hypothetical protein
MPAGSKQSAPVSTPRMGPDLVNHLVIYLLRQPSVATSAASILRPDHFAQEPHFRLLWQAVLELSTVYGIGLIPHDALYLTVGERAGEDSTLTPELKALLLATPDDVGKPLYADQPDALAIDRPGLIHHAYHGEDPESLDKRFGMDLLKRFLNERAVVDAAIQAVTGATERVPPNFQAALDKIKAEHNKIQVLDKKIFYWFDEFPEDPKPIKVFTTGVSFLDEFMNGGHAPGEIYVLFGPTKAGKSFMAVQIAVRCGEYFAMQHDLGAPRKAAYLFSYEMLPETVSARTWSCGADIDYERLLQKIESGKQYSTRGNLEPYEKEYYQRKGKYDFKNLPGERERINDFMKSVGTFIVNIDFKKSGAGNGGVDEIVSVCNQGTLAGRPPGVILIDYLNLAVTRQLIAANMDPERQMRHGVRRYFQECIDKLAVQFQCPVWVLQQYNADANHASPAKILKSTQGAECRTINQDADMLFCLGHPDPETHVAQMFLDLARRSSNGGKTKLLQRQGQWARWVDVTGEYEVGSGTDEGRIVKKAKASMVEIDPAAVEMLKKPAPKPDPYKAAKAIAPTAEAF